MLTFNDYWSIQKISQEQLEKEFRLYFDEPAPVLSTAIVRIVLESAIEAGLVEVNDA